MNFTSTREVFQKHVFMWSHMISCEVNVKQHVISWNYTCEKAITCEVKKQKAWNFMWNHAIFHMWNHVVFFLGGWVPPQNVPQQHFGIFPMHESLCSSGISLPPAPNATCWNNMLKPCLVEHTELKKRRLRSQCTDPITSPLFLSIQFNNCFIGINGCLPLLPNQNIWSII